MNDIEKYKLKELLKTEVEHLKNSSRFRIIDEMIALDEDNGQFQWTKAEILVFGLNKDLFHELIVAYMGYEVLIGTVEDMLSKETNALILKARAICPPAKYYEYECEFRELHDDKQWFMWFASEFMGLPEKQAYKYHAKRTFNMMGITNI